MAGGGDPSNIPKLTGLSKYFNSHTTTGRANAALATYVGVAAFYFYMKFKPEKKN